MNYYEHMNVLKFICFHCIFTCIMHLYICFYFNAFYVYGARFPRLDRNNNSVVTSSLSASRGEGTWQCGIRALVVALGVNGPRWTVDRAWITPCWTNFISVFENFLCQLSWPSWDDTLPELADFSNTYRRKGLSWADDRKKERKIFQNFSKCWKFSTSDELVELSRYMSAKLAELCQRDRSDCAGWVGWVSLTHVGRIWWFLSMIEKR